MDRSRDENRPAPRLRADEDAESTKRSTSADLTGTMAEGIRSEAGMQDLGADPFDDARRQATPEQSGSAPSDDGLAGGPPPLPAPDVALVEIPHIDPMTPPARRKALVAELRGLVRTDSYMVDSGLVALAVMKEGVFRRSND